MAFRLLLACCLCSVAFSQIGQKEACQKFSDAVVRIDAGGLSRGTGFLISPDGWILTAAHVVLDEEEPTAKYYASIVVTLSSGNVKIATVGLPIIDQNMVARDYALLKIDGHNLPHLDLGDTSDNLVLGGDVTIIGFPFSAVAYRENGPSVKDKFCLSGAIASFGLTDVNVVTSTPKGSSTINVKVDVVYFQGPSVKGLSGSPIISRDSGHVIAILTSKLTGISSALAETRKRIGPGPGVAIDDIPFGKTTGDLIDTLDFQLANGLGAGSGIEDPKAAFRRVLRERGRAK